MVGSALSTQRSGVRTGENPFTSPSWGSLMLGSCSPTMTPDPPIPLPYVLATSDGVGGLFLKLWGGCRRAESNTRFLTIGVLGVMGCFVLTCHQLANFHDTGIIKVCTMTKNGVENAILHSKRGRIHIFDAYYVFRVPRLRHPIGCWTDKEICLYIYIYVCMYVNIYV